MGAKEAMIRTLDLLIQKYGKRRDFVYLAQLAEWVTRCKPHMPGEGKHPGAG